MRQTFSRLDRAVQRVATRVITRRSIAILVRRSVGPLVLAAALLGLSAAPASAQSAHYWGSQFGNESVLLNGAVIGSVTDLGAVFYNPARLLHSDAPAFVVSAKLYEWMTIRVNDALGEGENLEQSTFGGAPGFLGGTFTLPFLEGHQFAYGFLTRNRAEVNYFLRGESSGDLLDPLEGEDDFVGFVDIGRELRDDWIGLSWAHPLSERWSLGATGFYFNRSSGRRVDLDLRAISEANDAAGFQVERTYRVSDQGLLGKLGVAWRGDAVSAGLTVTTPYWSILSGGTIRYENFQIGVPSEDGTGFDNILESTVQTGRPVKWKTPWSVGAGLGWNLGQWLFHGATEYYASVPRHVVIQADPVPGQSTGEPIDYSVVEERQAVINGGVGARWTASESFTAFGSVATNFSAAPDSVIRHTEVESVASHTTMQMDFVLLGAGVSFHTSWADITFGGTWQASSERAPRPLNLPDGDEPVFDDALATLKIDQWRFVFGFSFPFAEDLTEGITGGG